jgi:hypothetical protein
MRLLVGRGVFAEDEDGQFKLTALAERLRTQLDARDSTLPSVYCEAVIAQWRRGRAC